MKKIYLSLLSCMLVYLGNTQWTDKTSVNTMVADRNASDIQTANTNDGRIWIAFYSQNGDKYDMRAQLLDADGNHMFGDSGVLVSNRESGSATFVFNVCVDNDNNLIIAFQVTKGADYECVMQKVSVSGKLLWKKKGVDLGPGLSPYPSTLTTNEIAVAWNNNGKIDYQKVSPDGIAAWATVKEFGGNSTHNVSRAQLLAGAQGRFYMVYQDQFAFPFYTNLFEQKFDNDGNTLWPGAIKISTLTTFTYRYYDVLIEKDTAYVGYYGNPSGSNRFDAYVQKIFPDGSLPWGINGSYFANYSGNNDPFEQTIYIAKKPSSGYIWAVCTITNSLQTKSGVYAQKYDAKTGNNYFGTTAKEVLPISAKLNSLAFCKLSLCSGDPVFLTTNTGNKLTAVKLKDNGDLAWGNNTKVIGASTNSKFRYGFTDFYKGQAVAVWQEDKGNGEMPYAQNITCDGETGLQETIIADDAVKAVLNSGSIKNIYPNPVQNNLTVTITSATQVTTLIYVTDLGGNVMKQFQQTVQKGNNSVQLNVSNLKAGSYFIKVSGMNAISATMFNKQ